MEGANRNVSLGDAGEGKTPSRSCIASFPRSRLADSNDWGSSQGAVAIGWEVLRSLAAEAGAVNGSCMVSLKDASKSDGVLKRTKLVGLEEVLKWKCDFRDDDETIEASESRRAYTVNINTGTRS